MIEWTEEPSWRRTLACRVAGIYFVIQKDLRDTERWFLTSSQMDISCRDMKTEDEEEAKRRALATVRRRVLELRTMCGDFLRACPEPRMGCDGSPTGELW